jgi:putative DNA primase/helicase
MTMVNCIVLEPVIKKGDKAGWYILYGDGIPAGSFGDWRTGANHTWRADMGRKLSEIEKLEYQKKLDIMRQACEAAEERRHYEASKQAAGLLNAAIEAPISHPCPLQKGVEASQIAKPNGVRLICSTDIEPKAVAWLWKNWLALSKFHILAGTPGTGKTTIALNLAAIISRGGQWPDGTQCGLPGNVLIWSGEDDPEDTLLPRLLMHGADQKRIYFISDVIENNTTRVFDPSCDIPKLYEKAAKMESVRLIIIDPIVNAISGDSHKNVEVRRSLQPLIELGKKLKAVILGISHFSKGGTLGREPLERVTGSIAFGALARIVLATAKINDPNGEEKRILVRAKSNHGPDGDGYYYHIEQKELEGRQNVFGSQIVWGEVIQGNPRDLLTDPNELRTSKAQSALSEAVGFLKEILAEGLVDNRTIIEKAKELNINYSTLQRAKTLLEIEPIHEGFGKGSIWKWCLPSKKIKNLKDVYGLALYCKGLISSGRNG